MEEQNNKATQEQEASRERLLARKEKVDRANFSRMLQQDAATKAQRALMNKIESGDSIAQPRKAMIKKMLMQKKSDFIQAAQAKKSFSSNSEEASMLNQEEDNIKSSFPEIQNELQGFQEGAQEFVQDINSFSKSSNPDHITALSSIYAGNYKDFTEQEGQRGFVLPDDSFIPLKQVNMMQKGLNRPDFKTYNELKTNSFAMQEKISKEGPSAWNPAQAEFQVNQRLDDVADGQGGNDPMKKKERYLSLMTDTFNDDKNFESFLKEKYPKIPIDPLKQMVEEGNYEQVKPFLTEHLMEGITRAANAGMDVYNKNNATQPEIDFSSLDAINSEISRLQNLSPEERFATDYSEGSVEGSISERLAKLQMQKQALNVKKSNKNQ